MERHSEIVIATRKCYRDMKRGLGAHFRYTRRERRTARAAGEPRLGIGFDFVLVGNGDVRGMGVTPRLPERE